MDKLEMFDDEVKLKKYLDSFGLRYDEKLNSPNQYVCTFFDNKSGTKLTQGLYNTPIAACRDFNKIIEATKFPLDDITLQLHGVLISDCKDYILLDCELSPYLYFKKPVKTSKK